ncbi:TonB-dependent receptor [Chitinophaga sp. Ak27]|uniref:TonB-dependent receptor n=1 Tax=Chitinophaga sp. Ak27 TaxID=2726116 RepID=UPI00145F2E40|nr:TonB-dependent receptor [Chitinophaga sp. Ak27]NLU90484.1 TonB-dependent receptor [Chitinophaga sp. Ak27]
MILPKQHRERSTRSTKPLCPGTSIKKVLLSLLLLPMLQLSVRAMGQNITLHLKNSPFKNALEAIKSQSGYDLVLVQSHLEGAHPVSIDLVNGNIQEAMAILTNGQPVSYEIKEKAIILQRKENWKDGIAREYQKQPVSGQVRDENGVLLPGVTVHVKGTTNGANTDEKGNFRLDVSKGDILVISYVGYETKEISFNGQHSLDIRLKLSESALSEVIVVGYGTQKKGNLTGAVSTIDSKILENRPVTRLSQALQGAVANLNITTTYGGGAPNATQSFNIRGYTGLGTTQGPLIVIDGVQAGDINAINPSDIENISIIKDAAAAAVYGSSAPYGVILITTKKGKTGKPTISYNNTITTNVPIGLPKMINSLDFAALFNEAGSNAGYGPTNYFSADLIQRMKDYQVGTLKTETMANPNPGSDSWLGYFGANSNNDWFKVYYKNSQVIQQHNLSISGGSEKTKYFVGLGYNDKPGMYRYGKDIYRRYNLRVNLSNKISDWLEFNIRSTYSKETYDAPWAGGGRTGGNWMHQIARKHPNLPLYNPNGELSEPSDVLLMEKAGRHLEAWDKPLLTGELVITPVKGWSTTFNYTYEANISNINDHVATVFQTLPSGKPAPIAYTYPNSFSRNISFGYHHVFNAFSSYETSFRQHNFRILAGFVSELQDNMSLYAGNSQLYTDNIPSLSTAYGKTPSVSDYRAQLASEGFFGRFNYDYNGKYLLELTGRYDGTSRFLHSSRWGFYPGMSAGWNIHNEDFWKKGEISTYINSLKIRGSYGSLGDQSFGDATNSAYWYPFYPGLGTSSTTSTNWYFANGREAATNAPGLVNTNVTWVTTTTLNLGADVTALNDRLSVAFDWYKRSAKDYLGPARNLPAVLGTGVPSENAAAIETKGFELTLGWKDHVGELYYNLRATLSNYKGIVTRYPNDQKLLSNWYEGEKMGEIWGYQTVGYFKDDTDVAKSPVQNYIYTKWGAGDIKYADLNGDGKIDRGSNTLSDHGDLKVIGNTTPQYQYGFFANLNWKTLDVGFFIQGVAKRNAFVGGDYFWGIVGSEWQSSVFTVHNDRWTPTTPNGYFPKYYMSGEMSKNEQTQSKYLQNAGYLRLKNIQIGYTIPQNLLGKIGVQRVRFFVMAENVFTITPLKKHSTMDPEIFFSDGKIYPLQRGYSGGINVTF